MNRQPQSAGIQPCMATETTMAEGVAIILSDCYLSTLPIHLVRPFSIVENGSPSGPDGSLLGRTVRPG